MGYFVANLRIIWCTFSGLNKAEVYQKWQISSIPEVVVWQTWVGAMVQSGFFSLEIVECVWGGKGGRLWVEAIRSINAKLCQVSSISSGQSAIRFLFTLNRWERVRGKKKNMAHGGRGLWSQSGHTGNLFPKLLISKKRVTFTRRSIAAEDTNIHDPIWWP